MNEYKLKMEELEKYMIENIEQLVTIASSISSVN